MDGEIIPAAWRDFRRNSASVNSEAFSIMALAALFFIISGFGLLWTGAFDLFRRD